VVARLPEVIEITVLNIPHALPGEAIQVLIVAGTEAGESFEANASKPFQKCNLIPAPSGDGTNAT
jgi:hypothetical protein